MAVGEYVSVSTQRDTERALLARERGELDDFPEQEFEELVSLYEAKGLHRDTATTVATELTAHDAFAAHVDAELKIDPEALTNPWHAAISSAASFTVGAILPLLAILLPPAGLRIPVTFVAVVAALALTGGVSAGLGGSKRWPAMRRIVAGGAIAMVVTYGIGQLVGLGMV
jgi:vacuolar iron transporter family protein